MRVEAADDVSAAVVIDDRRSRTHGIRPIKPQAYVSGWTWNHLFFDPRDGERLGLARLGGRLHLGARFGRRHRLDRLEVGLGHDLKDALDLWVKIRHEILRF